LPGLGLSVLLLLAAPAQAAAPPEHVPAPGVARPIARVWLRGVGLDEEALIGAVAARLGDKQILTAGRAAAAIDGPVALCHVTAHGGQLSLEVILGDGRVYQRQIAARAGGRERAAARLIASTLASIEDETARPDRSDGVFVAPVAAAPTSGEPTASVATPTPAGPPAGAVSPVIPPSAGTVSPAVPSSTSEVSPIVPSSTGEVSPVVPSSTSEAANGSVRGPSSAVASVPGPSPRRPVAPATATDPPEAAAQRSPPTLELGVALAGGVVLGLGAPPAGAGLAGGGGGLRIDLKLRRGLLLGAGFRGLVRLHEGLALGRFRGALGLGYLLRRGAFELAAQAGPTLETWQVSEHGQPVTYTTSSASGASLLLGGLARAALGGRLTRARVSARIGGYVELAASARGNGRVPQIAREPGLAPVFVLGGAELSLGVEVELWFVLRRARG